MVHQRIGVPRQLLGLEGSWGGQSSLLPVALNPALSTLSRSRRVLQLQGPVGPFYDRMAQWLQRCGAQVDRVVFHGGDRADCRGIRPIEFLGTPESWPGFLHELIARREIDCVVLFGQSRDYHRMAIEELAESGIPVVVLEEGYFRPGFVTMELGGVNGYSSTVHRFAWQAPEARQAGNMAQLRPGGIEPHLSPHHFRKMALHACRHYMAMHQARGEFTSYRHHRVTDPYFYAAYWLRSWLRKYRRTGPDLEVQRQLFAGPTPYFFVPLQFDGDAQITQHSRYPENVHFIIEVMRSFATHAPDDARLVFKQHPHARGGLSHSNLIFSLAEELGLAERVLHLVEGDTPELAEHAAGVVLINSTVGFQALERNAPLMVMGEAIYKRPELTHSGSLNDFWGRPMRPDPAVVEAFLCQVKNLTQAPASVYANRDEPLNWPVPVR